MKKTTALNTALTDLKAEMEKTINDIATAVVAHDRKIADQIGGLE